MGYYSHQSASVPVFLIWQGEGQPGGVHQDRVPHLNNPVISYSVGVTQRVFTGSCGFISWFLRGEVQRPAGCRFLKINLEKKIIHLLLLFLRKCVFPEPQSNFLIRDGFVFSPLVLINLNTVVCDVVSGTLSCLSRSLSILNICCRIWRTFFWTFSLKCYFNCVSV